MYISMIRYFDATVKYTNKEYISGGYKLFCVSDPAKIAERCQCPSCIQKQIIIEHSQPYKSVKNFFIKLAIISGWVLLGFLAYKVSQFDYEMSNFDPYEILGLPPGATQAEIKKSYRKQSLILHPDKETGDEKAFMKLTKAYQVIYFLSV